MNNLKKTKEYDKIKLSLCNKNDVKVLYYTNLKNINEEKTIYSNINKLIKSITNE